MGYNMRKRILLDNEDPDQPMPSHSLDQGLQFLLAESIDIALDKALFSTKKYPYFLISQQKHMLWVLIRSASNEYPQHVFVK